METLFRFRLARPAMEQREETASIRLQQENSSLQENLMLSRGKKKSEIRSALKKSANDFANSGNEFVDSPQKLNIYEQLKKIDLAFDTLESESDLGQDTLVTMIESAFEGMSLHKIVSEVLSAPSARLKDSIIAIKLLPEKHHLPIEALANQLRDIEVIRKVHESDSFFNSGRVLQQYRRRSLMLPSMDKAPSVLNTLDKAKVLEDLRRESTAKKRLDIVEKLKTIKDLRIAVKELTSLGSEHFYIRAPEVTQDEYRRLLVQTLLQQIAQLKENRKAESGAVEVEGGVNVRVPTPAAPTHLQPLTEIKTTENKQSLELRRWVDTTEPSNFSGFRLKASAQSALSEGTNNLLKNRMLSISEHPMDSNVEKLSEEINDLMVDLDGMVQRPVKYSFKRYGRSLAVIKTPTLVNWEHILEDSPLAFYLLDNRIPKSHGSIDPVGLADLMVVKQQLIRYEGGDVAHIENILKGEKKARDHTRRRETESLQFRESESVRTEERELESTNRFEMSSESTSIIKSDEMNRAGMGVSASYGPVVTVAASAERSTRRSKEQSIKTASNFSKDITERSASNISERVLERTSMRILNEVVDHNHHSLDNTGSSEGTGGLGHISGVYQWQNKVYEAQMFNYGLHTMYDIMVPEPGAYLVEALAATHENTIELEKPEPFLLRSSQISSDGMDQGGRFYYKDLAQLYGATDVEPPPPAYITEVYEYNSDNSMGAGSEGDEKKEAASYVHSGKIKIAKGYKAISGSIGCVARSGKFWNNWNTVVLGDQKCVFIGVEGSSVGRLLPTPDVVTREQALSLSDIGGAIMDGARYVGRVLLGGGSGEAKLISDIIDKFFSDVLEGETSVAYGEVMEVNLDGKTDWIPIALSTTNLNNVAVAVEIKCQRTYRALEQWQHETHAKLTAAYNARLAEYEEKKTALEIQAGVEIEGKNPELNLELMRDELKKHCISILTEQHFELFGAVGSDDENPEIDFRENEAEGPYVRFFEQAFLWEHMTWVSYPYFWGRNTKWVERISYEDSDPLFNQFLKAGYCRVELPVRPGFENGLDHFKKRGEIWEGGPLPVISDPDFLRISDEIAEQLDRPGSEVPEGEPWLVKVPTSLVKLRHDDKLPKWQLVDKEEPVVRNGKQIWVELESE